MEKPPNNTDNWRFSNPGIVTDAISKTPVVEIRIHIDGRPQFFTLTSEKAIDLGLALTKLGQSIESR
jgi:hypothetical protein